MNRFEELQSMGKHRLATMVQKLETENEELKKALGGNPEDVIESNEAPEEMTEESTASSEGDGVDAPPFD